MAVVEVGLDDPLILAVDHAPSRSDSLHDGKSVAVELVRILVLGRDVPRSEVVQVAVQFRRRVLGIPELNAQHAPLADRPHRLVTIDRGAEYGLNDPLPQGVDDSIAIADQHACHAVREALCRFELRLDDP